MKSKKIPKAGAGEAVAFVTADGEVLFAEGHNLLALIKAMPEPPFGRKTLPLYATQQHRGDGVRVTDEMVERACRRHNVGWSLWPVPQKKTAREVMRAALESALSIEQGETAP